MFSSSCRIQGPREPRGCAAQCAHCYAKVRCIAGSRRAFRSTAALRITNVYSSESYDYPVQVQESLAELSTTIGAGFSNLASHIPSSSQSPPASPPAQKQREAPVPVHKTLPHALTRASHSAATLLPPGDRLGKAFTEYATGWDKIAEARVEQDARIQQGFLQGWQTTLTTSLGVAMKARQAVKSSRLELDAAKQTYVSG